MLKKEDTFKIGTIGKPHGVRGELTFNFTDDVFDRTDADYLLIEVNALLVPFFIEDYRFKNDTTALISFDGIDNEDEARELAGCDVYFERRLADKEEGHRPSQAEIIGYHIVDAANGNTIGTITGVDDSTINVLFQVEAAGGKELLIPASADLITHIDNEGRSITMQLPEGILNF